MKKAGFTLVETLGVISVIAILAIGVQVSYTRSVAKARDSVRNEVLDTVKKYIDIDLIDGNPLFSSHTEFENLLARNHYSMIPIGDICYFVASIKKEDSGLDQDEYVVATWGETRSDSNAQPGIVAVGTSQALINLRTANVGGNGALSITADDFLCSRPIGMEKVNRGFLGDPDLHN